MIRWFSFKLTIQTRIHISSSSYSSSFDVKALSSYSSSSTSNSISSYRFISSSFVINNNNYNTTSNNKTTSSLLLQDRLLNNNNLRFKSNSSTKTTTTTTIKALQEKMDPFIPQARQFVNFIDSAPSPYHATSQVAEMLKQKGFIQLSEKQEWDIKPNGKYFFTRNQSCVSAFIVGGKFNGGNGFNIAAAHTDSPNLKVRPVSNVESAGYLQVGVETYGGGLWYTWFDRDLTVAGRVIIKGADGSFESKLVHVKRPILRIPSLAIHLDRSVNSDGFKYNAQNHIVPILASQINAKLTNGDGENYENKKHHPILLDILAKELHCSVNDIQNFDLSICDTQPAAIGGALQEYIFSPRLDNLCMSYCSIEGLLRVSDEHIKQEESVLSVVLFDNEEVGSSSPQGACAPLITDTITRVNHCFVPAGKDINTIVDLSLRRSFLVSADMAHAIHPNYSGHHEPLHRPQLNKGPVIKYNANLRYATTGPTSFTILELAKRNGIPVQEFLVKNDSPCGSTIGPIISGSYGIRTVDIGNPQLSMHSIRETCGVVDITYGFQLIQKFFEQFSILDKSIKVDLE
ncbi:aspartyl aminopeptidase [Cavenderia fasciculata]|uniref:aspartyl aminopeptidase n=1 Tax=Cavenderia fasciculata TaxID=261658 RepID=F4PL00_CACFS|nr:aspartyl aminopeptidase [Cavenderia fasciculata]EGG23222.1 aspartyl aminopeptidase [Cavenderia fasciculata]|eukprot:XP_004361073.1 aspartyl aminopeptidase [Cavenderia fasciculata]